MSTPVPERDLIPWVAFTGTDGKQLRTELQDEWKGILGDKDNKEEVYQQFVAENAGLFFSQEKVVISKVPLGADHVTDFVIGRDKASYGFSYEFVELESPHTPAFTSKGHPSSRLSMAVQQVLNWQTWLNANRSEAKKLFPSSPFRLYDTPSFSFTIYIGRSSNRPDQLLALRNTYAQQLDINIHGFDNLTRSFPQPLVGVFPPFVEAGAEELEAHIRNKLANPFVSAYSWGAWKEMVKQPLFYEYHMIGKNWKLLLKYRKYSRTYENFLNLLRNLSPERKEYYSSVLREWEQHHP
jgi:hypothetical protein